MQSVIAKAVLNLAPWASLACLGLSWAAWGRLGPPGAALGRLGLPLAALDCLWLFWATLDFSHSVQGAKERAATVIITCLKLIVSPVLLALSFSLMTLCLSKLAF